jgi:hypothetical protein
MKWRYYCVERLPLLPHNFQEHMKAVMLLNAFTVEEIERRKRVFMELWQEMRPLVEHEVKMTYDEIKDLV